MHWCCGLVLVCIATAVNGRLGSVVSQQASDWLEACWSMEQSEVLAKGARFGGLVDSIGHIICHCGVDCLCDGSHPIVGLVIRL